ncbi:ATP-binding protein [Corallococcus carmarthensis]|uniref:ATP-binding protein n=3 Tax=Corallococcus carmarthensis TaxID=2316728 RepID=A0A3A8KHB4_9BACT|nr:ATP-binding protein [Corallococcus carmarthensis]
MPHPGAPPKPAASATSPTPVPVVRGPAPQPPPAEAPHNGVVLPLPDRAKGEIDAAKERAEALKADPELEKAVGFTHFDTSSSHDNLVTVLSTKEDLHRLASQTLVRIKCRGNERTYLGVVVQGPFAEPNAVPANSTMAIGVVTHGKKLTYTFEYHGRAEVEILGEEVAGVLKPHRFRPRPQSAVFVLEEEESAKVLGVSGEMSIGTVVGYERMEARINARDKSVLPRHTGIIGTTGGGKSTTVATLIHRAQSSGIATIVFDVEGEYTHVDRPTDHQAMVETLKRRDQKPEGVKDLHIHHLVGRESRNPRHRNKHAFSLNFSSLSPYALAEILDMSEAQQERLLKAYDVTKLLLEDFEVYPVTEEERRDALEVDELSTGYPKMTIQHLLDVVTAYLYSLSDEGKGEGKNGANRVAKAKGTVAEEIKVLKEDEGPPANSLTLYSVFRDDPGNVMRRVYGQRGSSISSWRALASKLHRLRRLNIFDMGTTEGVKYDTMLSPGRVSVIDLSDTESPQLNNLVIADILRGVQERQEASYDRAHREGKDITPVLIIIEEAHEFLSASRIAHMKTLFEQVARIAKRGRKRWLGLVFVTQLPQHLPSEVLALLNNFIIHKITDGAVINQLKKSVGSIDESLWSRVSRLAPGQALMSFSHFTRPLMVAVDPAPVKRLLVD